MVLLATLPTFWFYAHYAKGYSLSLFLLSLFFLLITQKDRKYWVGGAVVFGISMGYLYQIMILAAISFLPFYWEKGGALWWLVFTLLGSLTYLFLPIRASVIPLEYTWGNPTTLSGFIEIIRGERYGFFTEFIKATSPVKHSLVELLLIFMLIFKEYLFFIPLIIPGGWYIKKAFPSFFFPSLIYKLLIIVSIAVIVKPTFTPFTCWMLRGFLLPVYFFLTFWVIAGAWKICETSVIKKCLWIVVIIFFFTLQFKENNERLNFLAYDYAKNILASLPYKAVIITDGENDTFPLWYLTRVEGMRPDVVVISGTLLRDPYYRKYLAKKYNITLPSFNPEEELVSYLKKLKSILGKQKVYFTFHIASKVYDSLLLTPGGLVYMWGQEEVNLKKLSQLVLYNYSWRGIAEKKYKKDVVETYMLAPYAKALYDLAVLYYRKGYSDEAERMLLEIEKIDFSSASELLEEFRWNINELRRKQLLLLKKK